MDDVRFDSDTFTSSARNFPPRKKDWADWLVDRKIVARRSQAQLALIGVAMLCFALAAFVLFSSGRPSAPDPSTVQQVV